MEYRKLQITIDLDNDAFAGTRASMEVRRILTTACSDLRDLRPDLPNAVEWSLRDINGNTVGKLSLGEP